MYSRLFALTILSLCPLVSSGAEMQLFPGYWMRWGMSDDGERFIQQGNGPFSLESVEGPQDFTEDGELRGRIAFLTNRDGTSIRLQHLPSHNRVGDAHLSRSGEFATGWSSDTETRGFSPAIWNSQGESQTLPVPPDTYAARGTAISNDGSVAVGGIAVDCGGLDCLNQPYRWTLDGTNYVRLELPILPGYDSGHANAISADGNVILGDSWWVEGEDFRDSTSKTEATLWINDNANLLSPIGLGNFNGKSTFGDLVSADGSTVVGSAGDRFTLDGREAFRWTQPERFTPLGTLPGADYTEPRAINSDASIIVGRYAVDGDRGFFVWDDDHSIRDLETVLIEEHGVDPTSFPDEATSQDIFSISGDGTALSGRYNVSGSTTGWVLHLDRPLVVTSGVPGDFNGNAELDAEDLDLLANEIRSDRDVDLFNVNGDSTVDIADREFWVGDLAQTFFGDANLDQSVEFDDFLVLSSGFGESGGWAQGDFDGSGTVGFADFLILSKNFGQSVGAQAAVPEPSGFGLIVIGLLAMVNFHRKRRVT